MEFIVNVNNLDESYIKLEGENSLLCETEGNMIDGTPMIFEYVGADKEPSHLYLNGNPSLRDIGKFSCPAVIQAVITKMEYADKEYGKNPARTRAICNLREALKAMAENDNWI